MANEHEEEPKLIIDEDWKTQVQREKEELKAKQSQGGAADESPQPAEAVGGEAPPEGPEGMEQLPPASFPLLLTSLATQALAALGQMPDENGQPLPVDLVFAKHFIDLIGMLEEKTKGNLNDEEASYLQETLHQLRMLFVHVSKNPPR